jgi:hypothetical protein
MAIHPTEHDLSDPNNVPDENQAALFNMPGEPESTIEVPDSPADLAGDGVDNTIKSPNVGDLANSFVVDARETRASFLGNVLNTKAKKAATAAGLVVALGAGVAAYAATRGNGEPTAHARTPVATSTPNISPTSASPVETSPSPVTPSATSEAPVSKVPVPNPTETPSVGPGEVATEVVLPVSYFKEVMKDQSKTFAELADDFPGLEEKTSADAMMLKATEAGVTARRIGQYQDLFNKSYDNPTTRTLLGDPNGSMAPSQLADYDSADNIAGLVPATNDSYLNGISEAIAHDAPGASKALLNLTSINPALVRGNLEKIENAKAEGRVAVFNVSPASFLVNAIPFKTADKANTTLLASLNYQENGKKVLQLSVLIPVANPNANVSPDSMVAIPYSIQYAN